MSAIIALAINDGAAVSKTFGPEIVSGEQVVYSEKTSGIASTYPRMRVTYSPSTNTRKTTRVTFDVSVPVAQVVDGVTQVAMVLRGKSEFILPDGCTDAQRKDLFAFFYNAINTASIRGAIRDYDPLY